MRRERLIILFIVIASVLNAQDSLRFSGQLSSWLNLSSGNEHHLYAGIRYIPQLYFKPGKASHFDTELSANINGSMGFPVEYSAVDATGQIKPYRAWVRYSTDQLEVRLGLQKINFGSANILRPLMWFDKVDPRDPLKLTDGVWGILGRYYFLNNANIWLWGLYGNSKPRGWEYAGTNKNIPEAGGRIQVPVPKGEAAFTYNFRYADTRTPLYSLQSEKVPENKFGFDMKLDLVVGLWIEGSWTKKNSDLNIFNNQEILNAGIDYTFGVGNGLYITGEQMMLSYDEKPFEFKNRISFSLLSVSYPLTISDNISGIVYYDWENKKAYNFVNWQKQFKNVVLYIIGYWNPELYYMPAQESSQNLFLGKGLQFMLVFNH